MFLVKKMNPMHKTPDRSKKDESLQPYLYKIKRCFTSEKSNLLNEPDHTVSTAKDYRNLPEEVCQ